ncbi:hypothetical protein POVWA2_014960 [Plasmodium ovale wallikeri]|uniref:Merozoite surface protein (SPAM), putative n=2 Tax=Plasmodium ovale TaxID=36330 RepID=A0A1C3KQA0_PLAOA|nr:hypothetical protein POVWA2_014960 [Plasmodium ovale wallikeri]SBT76184.1 Merozoite surface protein (SPAM), putative [Plasmodium ovale]
MKGCFSTTFLMLVLSIHVHINNARLIDNFKKGVTINEKKGNLRNGFENMELVGQDEEDVNRNPMGANDNKDKDYDDSTLGSLSDPNLLPNVKEGKDKCVPDCQLQEDQNHGKEVHPGVFTDPSSSVPSPCTDEDHSENECDECTDLPHVVCDVCNGEGCSECERKDCTECPQMSKGKHLDENCQECMKHSAETEVESGNQPHDNEQHGNSLEDSFNGSHPPEDTQNELPKETEGSYAYVAQQRTSSEGNTLDTNSLQEVAMTEQDVNDITRDEEDVREENEEYASEEMGEEDDTVQSAEIAESTDSTDSTENADSAENERREEASGEEEQAEDEGETLLNEADDHYSFALNYENHKELKKAAKELVITLANLLEGNNEIDDTIKKLAMDITKFFAN